MLLAKLVTIHSSWHMSPAIIITKAVVLILEVIKCVRRDTFFEGSGSCRLAINHPLVCLEKTSHHEWLNTFLNLRKIDLRVPAALCGCSRFIFYSLVRSLLSHCSKMNSKTCIGYTWCFFVRWKNIRLKYKENSTMYLVLIPITLAPNQVKICTLKDTSTVGLHHHGMLDDE